MNGRADRVCVVGAGAAGLAAGRHLLHQGFPCHILERESDLGGIWNHGSPAGRVYRSTHTISSKPTTQFPDFPMPEEWPDYPHHSQVLAYLRDYAAWAGVDRHIEYRTGVERVTPAEDERWRVRTDSGEERTYRAVVVANGHNWAPRVPELPGSFHGRSLHSADYLDAGGLEGKRVLVVGGGNSGADIAVDAARAGARVLHSVRRGYHMIPKYVLGRPADQVADLLLKLRLPLPLRRMAAALSIRTVHGRNREMGLPEPDHRLFETHPLVTSLLPYYLRHHAVRPKPDIDRLEGEGVRFVDGSREPVDVIIYATGYRVTVPFLEPGLLRWAEGRPHLYLNLLHPEHDTLSFAGFIQPDSGEIFLLHWQARLLALFLRGLEEGAPEALGLREAKRGASREDLSGGIRHAGTERHALEVEHRSYWKRLRRLVGRLERDLQRSGRRERPRRPWRRKAGGAPSQRWVPPLPSRIGRLRRRASDPPRRSGDSKGGR